MGTYTSLAYGTTFVFGSILSYFYLQPLGLLVYLLIWTDIFLLAKIPVVQSIGFEFQTLAAIIGGVTIGSVSGFLFSLFGIPLLITALVYIVKNSINPRVPNIHYVAMALAAAFAGLLAPFLPLLAVVVLSVLFKQVAFAMLHLRLSFGVNMATSLFNTIFSLLIMLGLERIGFLAFLS